MRHIAFLIIFFTFLSIPFSSSAQSEYTIPGNTYANNGELEWYVYKDKVGEIKVSKKDVEINSTKNNGMVAFTFAKAPIDFNGDFYLSATLKPDKVDDKHLFGFAFNVPNENDYNAIMFDNQFCYYVRVVNGRIKGLRDRTLYKKGKSKDKKWRIAIERKNLGEFSVTLNGLEIRTFPSTTPFSFPAIGACAINKNKVKITEVSYTQWAAPAEQ